jgi:hypothetical protein
VRTLSPSRLALLFLEGFTALGALAGAEGLTSNGERFLGGRVRAEQLPFGSFVFCGVLLLILNGLLPAAAMALELRRHSKAPIAHLSAGIVLVAWMVVQLWYVGYLFFLQPLMAGIGVVIAGLAVARLQRGSRDSQAR